MLMYELVESAGIEEREVSLAPTIDTVETMPEGITVSEDGLEEDTDWENETPSTERSFHFEKRTSLQLENNPMTEDPLRLADVPTPDDRSQSENTPTDGPLQLENDPTNAGPSLLEMVESKLEETHISPTSSIASHSSTDDLIVELEQKSTRSTSFSSIHSRPQTPIVEAQDPQLSPPPLKGVRREMVAQNTEGVDISDDGTGSLVE